MKVPRHSAAAGPRAAPGFGRRRTPTRQTIQLVNQGVNEKLPRTDEGDVLTSGTRFVCKPLACTRIGNALTNFPPDRAVNPIAGFCRFFNRQFSISCFLTMSCGDRAASRPAISIRNILFSRHLSLPVSREGAVLPNETVTGILLPHREQTRANIQRRSSVHNYRNRVKRTCCKFDARSDTDHIGIEDEAPAQLTAPSRGTNAGKPPLASVIGERVGSSASVRPPKNELTRMSGIAGIPRTDPQVSPITPGTQDPQKTGHRNHLSSPLSASDVPASRSG